MSQQPYPDETPETGWWETVFDVEVSKRYAQVQRTYPDGPRAFRWASRTAYDIAAGLTKEQSLAKHLKELEDELGITPQPEPPPTGDFLPPLQGDVQLIDGGRGGIRDDSGRRLAVTKHAGDFVARIINDPNGKATVIAALDYLKSVGVHALRVWFFLPGEWWATPPRPGNADPHDPRWEPAVRWLCEQMRDRGLYLMADGGDFYRQYPNQPDRVAAAERWGRLLASTGVRLFSVGTGNESWQNGESYDATPDSVQRMAEVLRAFERGFGRRVPISTLTSVRDEGLLNDYVRGTDSPTVISYHGTRGPFRHATERAWTAAYADSANATEPKFRAYLLDDEPAGVNSKDGPVGSGPGTHVSSTSPSDMAVWRKLEAYGIYMAAHFIGKQTPTILTSTGIISDEPFQAYPHIAHVSRIAALLPRDVQGWKHFHGGDGRDFSPLRVLSVNDEQNQHRVRCEHALNTEGEVVVAVYCTQPGSYPLPVINGFEGDIITPDASLVRHRLSLKAGSSLTVDMDYGRIFIGRKV